MPDACRRALCEHRLGHFRLSEESRKSRKPRSDAQTGITAGDVAQARSSAQALGALDERFTPEGRYLLVAQHAATEAGLIHNQREHCPRLARIDLLDTIPLAKHLVPGLPNYKLDTLLTHYSIPHPADRHRAMADVEATGQVFIHLIGAAHHDAQLTDLAALVKLAGRTAKCNIPAPPVQSELFSLGPT